VTQVRVRGGADLRRLADAWSTFQERRFPGSGEDLDDELADALALELLGEDSALAGAVDTLLGHGATERRYLEKTNADFERLLARARACADPSPDLVRVIEYANELERVRALALEVAG
jgi:hypothetical protein